MKPLTSFQIRVYTVVKQIPVGETRTYAWVAWKAGSEGSARAVGNALNKNPFPVIVPCHRVVPSNGSPGKYALGTEIKKKLLSAESNCTLF
jgi:O-6-methylguanine DNA methyltransferase